MRDHDAVAGRPLQLLGGQFGSPPLHEIPPGGTGRREMQPKPGVLDQPAVHRGRFVGCAIVQHKRHGEVGRDGRVQLVQKRLGLLAAVMAPQAPLDCAALQIHGCKQAGGPMAQMVVTPACPQPASAGSTPGPALSYPRSTSRPAQGGSRSRATPASTLSPNSGSADNLRLPAVPWEPKRAPNPAHGRLGQAHRPGPPARQPGRRVRRRFLLRLRENLLHLLIRSPARRAWPRQVRKAGCRAATKRWNHLPTVRRTLQLSAAA